MNYKKALLSIKNEIDGLTTELLGDERFNKAFNDYVKVLNGRSEYIGKSIISMGRFRTSRSTDMNMDGLYADAINSSVDMSSQVAYRMAEHIIKSATIPHPIQGERGVRSATENNIIWSNLGDGDTIEKILKFKDKLNEQYQKASSEYDKLIQDSKNKLIKAHSDVINQKIEQLKRLELNANKDANEAKEKLKKESSRYTSLLKSQKSFHNVLIVFGIFLVILSLILGYYAGDFGSTILNTLKEFIKNVVHSPTSALKQVFKTLFTTIHGSAIIIGGIGLGIIGGGVYMKAQITSEESEI